VGERAEAGALGLGPAVEGGARGGRSGVGLSVADGAVLLDVDLLAAGDHD